MYERVFDFVSTNTNNCVKSGQLLLLSRCFVSGNAASNFDNSSVWADDSCQCHTSKQNTDKRMKNIDAFFLIRCIYKGESKEKWNYVNDFFFGI